MKLLYISDKYSMYRLPSGELAYIGSESMHDSRSVVEVTFSLLPATAKLNESYSLTKFGYWYEVNGGMRVVKISRDEAHPRYEELIAIYNRWLNDLILHSEGSDGANLTT